MELDAFGLGVAALLLIVAALYASVGHAGASGYLAVMALVGIAPAVMKPTALVLNVVVALIATYKFYRVGSFSWRLFLLLSVAAVPLAYVGGSISLPSHIYKPLVGLVLIYAAFKSFSTAKQASQYSVREANWPILVVAGGLLGFLSGLTGVGGGIFLSPLLLFLRWAPVKVISGVAAAFILLNSISGLAGAAREPLHIQPVLPLWAIAVVIGGYVGAEYGSKRLGNPAIQRLLALVLLVAGAKMMATA